MKSLTLIALQGIPEVRAGESLGAHLLRALDAERVSVEAGDVFVVAQKIVSKSEGRRVPLDDVRPSARAYKLAEEAQKDPRLMELVQKPATERPRGKLVALSWVLAPVEAKPARRAAAPRKPRAR